VSRCQEITVLSNQQQNAQVHVNGHLKNAPQSTDTLVSEQANLLFSQAIPTISAAFIVATVMMAVLWNVAPTQHLLMWWGGISIMTAYRVGLVIAYNRDTDNRQRIKKWLAGFYLGNMASGLLWSASILLLNAEWPLHYQALVFFSLAGISAGANTYAVVLPAYFSFQLSALIPIAIWLVWPENSVYQPLGLLLIVYCLAMVFIASKYHRAVKQSLQLGLDNHTLVNRLTKTNEVLEQEVTGKQTAIDNLQRERQLFYDGPVVVYRCRAESGWPIEYISSAVSQFGYDARHLMLNSMSFEHLIYTEDRKRVRDFVDGRINDSDARSIEQDYRLYTADGSERWVYDYTTPVCDEQGEITHYDGYLLDITSRKLTEHALLEEKERAQVTLDAIADGVITTNLDGEVLYLNPVAEELTGWNLFESHCHPIHEVFRVIQNSDSEHNRRERDQDGAHKAERSQRLYRRDGVQHYIHSKRSPILDENGDEMGYVIVFRDVTEQRLLTERLSYQATHDALTGLVNRGEFEMIVQASLRSSRATNTQSCVFYIDLDQFKVVNDTCGHVAGDALLQRLADGIPGLLRESDVVARLGGDEFGVLLEDCHVEQAVELAETIRLYVKESRFSWDNKMFDVGASIGVVEINQDSESVSDILSAADIACYAAKDMGRNCVHVYQRKDSESGRRHSEIQLVSQIIEAIENDDLVLYFQDIKPAGNVQCQGIHGEVLVRMKGDGDKLMPPGMFLPAAERYDLMPSLDLWVIRNTLRWWSGLNQTADFDSIGMVSINLSGNSLGNEGFCEQVEKMVRESGLPAGTLCFEITETAAIANFSKAIKFIKQLRSLGVLFALDDFGSGLSSFAYLKNLPVDFLKIDGAFVRDIIVDPIDCEIVKSIHKLATVMGIKTIAEFVENEQIHELLVDIGVDYVQGYGIAKPRPLEIVAAQAPELRSAS